VQASAPHRVANRARALWAERVQIGVIVRNLSRSSIADLPAVTPTNASSSTSTTPA